MSKHCPKYFDAETPNFIYPILPSSLGYAWIFLSHKIAIRFDKNVERMAKRLDADQTALFKQSDLGLHYMPKSVRIFRVNTLEHILLEVT